MGTQAYEIAEWFSEGVEMGHKYMAVICDTFDHSDYPSFYDSEDECRRHISKPGEMQRVMEVYNLRKDMERQVYGTVRCWAVAPNGWGL